MKLEYTEEYDMRYSIPPLETFKELLELKQELKAEEKFFKNAHQEKNDSWEYEIAEEILEMVFNILEMC